jgi:hypothetical protein
MILRAVASALLARWYRMPIDSKLKTDPEAQEISSEN